MVSDPLGEWWVHPVGLHRMVDNGAYGPIYDPPLDSDPVTVLGFVRDGSKLIAGPNGEQVTSSAQIALPAGTPYVPVQSQVTLPAMFGGRTSTVIACSVADGGGQPTPDHVELSLL